MLYIYLSDFFTNGTYDNCAYLKWDLKYHSPCLSLCWPYVARQGGKGDGKGAKGEGWGRKFALAALIQIPLGQVGWFKVCYHLACRLIYFKFPSVRPAYKPDISNRQLHHRKRPMPLLGNIIMVSLGRRWCRSKYPDTTRQPWCPSKNTMHQPQKNHLYLICLNVELCWFDML